MVYLRRAKLSHRLFQGFETNVDLDELDSLEAIAAAAVSSLCRRLRELNLEILAEIARDESFCIHGTTFEDILLQPSSQDIWVCAHTEGAGSSSGKRTRYP